MHPVKDTLNRDYDLTDKFKGFIESIIKDAQKALILADCPCPYPAETQMSKILNSVREATQVVHTVANDYQHRVPDSPEKEAVIREAWEKVEAIDAKQSDAFLPPSESADDLLYSLLAWGDTIARGIGYATDVESPNADAMSSIRRRIRCSFAIPVRRNAARRIDKQLDRSARRPSQPLTNPY